MPPYQLDSTPVHNTQPCISSLWPKFISSAVAVPRVHQNTTLHLSPSKQPSSRPKHLPPNGSKKTKHQKKHLHSSPKIQQPSPPNPQPSPPHHEHSVHSPLHPPNTRLRQNPLPPPLPPAPRPPSRREIHHRPRPQREMALHPYRAEAVSSLAGIPSRDTP